jgi:hypothetical protein
MVFSKGVAKAPKFQDTMVIKIGMKFLNLGACKLGLM